MAHFVGLLAVPIDAHALGQKLGAEHVREALVQGGECSVHGGIRQRHIQAAAPLLDQLAFMPNGKAHIGAGQCVAAHGLYAVREFGGVGFQELAARGRAVKQLFDFDGGALAPRHRAQLAGPAVEQIGIIQAASPRQYCAISYGIDSGQRFAAKAHGRHALQVVQVADLAGGVALEGDGQLVAQDALAVVFHADQAHTAGQQPQGDLGGAGVQRVVHQFTHHAGGALYDFTRRNLADKFVREFADGAAGCGSQRCIHICILGGQHNPTYGTYCCTHRLHSSCRQAP